MSNSGKLEVEGQTNVLLSSWEHVLKNNIPKIVSYGGWVGISEFPMHWWTNKIFQHIGMECGGLLGADQWTENHKYLFEATIRIRKNFIGFLLEILIRTKGNESYFVKIRPISSAIRPTIPGNAPSMISGSRNMKLGFGDQVPTNLSHPRADVIPQIDWGRGNVNINCPADGWTTVQQGRSKRHDLLADRTSNREGFQGSQAGKDDDGDQVALSRGGKAAVLVIRSLEGDINETGMRRKVECSNKLVGRGKRDSQENRRVMGASLHLMSLALIRGMRVCFWVVMCRLGQTVTMGLEMMKGNVLRLEELSHMGCAIKPLL